jgi:acyl carrier protein phosphodiesterase
MKKEEIEQYIQEHRRYIDMLTEQIREIERKRQEMVNEYIRIEGVLMFLENLKKREEREEKK